MFTLAIPTFAAEDLSYDGATAQSTLTYRVNGGYVIVIPETLDMDSGFALEASYLNIGANEQINVYMNTIQDDYITFTNENGDTLDLHITGHDENNCVAVFTDELTADYYILGYLDDDVMHSVKAGQYTATAEFTVEKGLREATN